MRMNNKGMSTVAGLLVVVVVMLAIVGFGALAARFFFKPEAPQQPLETNGGTFKVDTAKLIADLEKMVQGIPADQAAANARGYEQLLALDPGNERYRRKLAYYRAQLKATAAAAPAAAEPPKVVEKPFVKIAFPAPRVLERPDAGEMVGRAPSGEMVEVLETQVIRKGSTYISWYRIPFKKSSGWISQMGVFGGVVIKTVPIESAAGRDSKWEDTQQGLIDAYSGKITAVEKISPEECQVQISSDLTFEQARQVSENIGYYIRNSTGASPVVTVFVGDLQIAVARLATNKYSGQLEVKNR
ncbi:MAG: hypothetical protein ABIL58_18040 [Pseudomonadota bacterium]